MHTIAFTLGVGATARWQRHATASPVGRNVPEGAVMARPPGGSDHAESIHRTGERFDRLLRAQGVSLDSLAKRVRLQKSTLDNFRAGHRKLPEDVLDAVARELGTSANYLMDRSDDDRPMAIIREEAAVVREQAAARALGQQRRR